MENIQSRLPLNLNEGSHEVWFVTFVSLEGACRLSAMVGGVAGDGHHGWMKWWLKWSISTENFKISRTLEGRSGEAKFDGVSFVAGGEKTWGAIPMSVMWGFGVEGGRGGSIINLNSLYDSFPSPFLSANENISSMSLSETSTGRFFIIWTNSFYIELK